MRENPGLQDRHREIFVESHLEQEIGQLKQTVLLLFGTKPFLQILQVELVIHSKQFSMVQFSHFPVF